MVHRREKRVSECLRVDDMAVSLRERGEGIDLKFHMCSTCAALTDSALSSGCSPEFVP